MIEELKPTYLNNNLMCLTKFYETTKSYFLKKKKEEPINVQLENDELGLKLLSPTDTAENAEIYCNAILEVLNNPKTANIALTGGYGSGKSSILETFISKNINNRKFNFLRISLANFNYSENKDANSNSSKIAGIAHDEFNKQISIEISLLQQIIYQSDSKKSTESRFSRIKFISKCKSWLYSLLFLITTLLCLISWNPYFLMKWFPIQVPYYISESFSFQLISFVFFAFSVSLIFVEFFNLLQKFKISKIDISSISFENSEQLSILNIYIDEILYLFQSNQFNVVIIEDIDRLKNHDLFTKLREINLILRNSPQTKKLDIKFIYALRDSIFDNETEKNKFFDVNIPIIPIINNLNSKSILLNLFGLINHKKTTPTDKKIREVLQPTSLCISDLRTINNIHNEFTIYQNYLLTNADLAKHKLLAMIIYKNLFPSDYEKIHTGDSVLQKLFARKDKLIEKELNSLNELIQSIQNELDNTQSEKIKTELDLRKLYISELFSLKSGDLLYKLTGKQVSFLDLTENDNFEKLIEHGISIYKHVTGEEFSVTFENLEKKIDHNLLYPDRIRQIKNNSDLVIKELINQKIQLQLKASTIETKSFSSFKLEDEEKNILKSLYDNKSIVLDVKKTRNLSNQEEQKLELIKVFLKNEFIEEDYYYYVSYIHEGALTANDSTFVLKVLNNTLTDYDYGLDNVSNVYNELKSCSFDFSKPNYLNIDFVNYIINNNSTGNVLDYIAQILTTNKSVAHSFLPKFLEKCDFPQHLIRKCTLLQSDFTFSYLNNKEIEENQKNHLISLILEYCVQDICKEQNEQDYLKYHIESLGNFTAIFTRKKHDLQQIIKNINALDIRFERFTLITNNELFKLIYHHNLYAINQSNIDLIIKYFSDHKKKPIYIYSYAELLNSGLSLLIAYVKSDLNEFVSNILLDENKILNLKKENSESLYEILNSTEVDFENKQNILESIDHLKLQFSEIDDQELWSLIIEKSIVSPNFENILVFHEMYGFDEPLVTLVNDTKWLESIEKLNIEDPNFEKLKEDFMDELISTENINKESLNLLIENVKFSSEINLEEASSNALNSLLKFKLIPLSFEKYNRLKQISQTNNDFIHLKYILVYQKEILSNWTGEYSNFTKDESMYLLSHIDILHEYVIEIMNNIPQIIDETFTKSDFTTLFDTVIINNYAFGDINIYKKIFENIEVFNQVRFFNYLFKNVQDHSFQQSLIRLFQQPHLKLIEPYLKNEIAYSNENEIFVENLKLLGLIKNYEISDDKKAIIFRRNKQVI